MKSKKIENLIIVLTPGDWRQLAQQFREMRGGEKSYLYRLLHRLRTDHRAFEHPPKLYATIYGRAERYNEKKLRDLSSELVRRIEDHLAATAVRDHTDLRQRALIRAYEQRKAIHMVKTVCTEGLRQLERQPVRSRIYLEQKLFLLERQIWTDLNSVELIRDRLTEIIDATRRLFTTILLDHQMGLTEIHAVLLEPLPPLTPYLRELVAETGNYPLFQYRLKGIELAGTILTEKQIEQRIEELRPLLKQITKEEQRDSLMALRNLSSRSAKVIGSAMRPAQFQIVKLLVDYKVIEHLPRLTTNFFGDLVQSALRVEAYEWADTFIREHITLISEEQREEVWSQTYCTYSLHLGNYDKALQYLQNFGNKKTEVTKTVLRLLYSVCYLGLILNGEDYHDVLESHLSAFERYARRTFPDNPRRLNKTLAAIRYFRKILKLSNRSRKERENGLKEMLTELSATTENIASKANLIRLIENRLFPNGRTE